MAIRKPPSRPFPSAEALTVDDWYALPDDGNRYELYEGMLVMAPSRDMRHQTASSFILGALSNYELAKGGCALPTLTGVAISPNTAFQPDVLYLSPERMRLASARGIEGAPDLVVEVASPSTRLYDVDTKLPAYLAAGVREVWIVDPVAATVTVHAAGGDPKTVAFGEEIPSTVVSVGNARLDRLPRIE